jgi:hypothetical protein
MAQVSTRPEGRPLPHRGKALSDGIRTPETAGCRSDARASTSGLGRIVTLLSVTPIGVIWQPKKSGMEECKSFCKSPHKNDSQASATTR